MRAHQKFGFTAGSWIMLRTMFAMAISTSCLVLSGCDRATVETIWSQESRSPDGLWIAKAETRESSSIAVLEQTTVTLQRSAPSSPEVIVLSFSQNPGVAAKLIDIEMIWADSTHLAVSYKQYPTVDFQAVKYSGVEISTHNLSD